MPSLDFALDHRVIGSVLRFSPIEPIGCASGNAQNVGYTSGREQERFWSYAKCSMSVLGTKLPSRFGRKVPEAEVGKHPSERADR